MEACNLSKEGIILVAADKKTPTVVKFSAGFELCLEKISKPKIPDNIVISRIDFGKRLIQLFLAIIFTLLSLIKFNLLAKKFPLP
jgi:hypothetical protein